MTTDEVIAEVVDFDPSKPCVELLPARKSYCRGAGLAYCVCTRELRLTTDKRTDRRYRVRELAVDRAAFHGRAFTLDKLTTGTDAEATDYTCLVSDLGEGHDSCECKGFLRHGHCGHLDALRAIIANGWDRIPHPCATPEYDAFTQAVDAGAPNPEPTGPACCLCRRPLAEGPADKSGLAHEDCAIQEMADQRIGDEMASQFDAEPDWVTEGGIGERSDVPF